MSGGTDLAQLLRSMEPVLAEAPYGFAASRSRLPAGLAPFATVAEDEGLTLVAEADALRSAGIDPGAPFARISLTVHSSLEAVGLTAAIAAALAAEGISANVIAGFHHDHIFVQWNRRAEAMSALRTLGAA